MLAGFHPPILRILALGTSIQTRFTPAMFDLASLRCRMIARQFLAMAKLISLRSNVLTPVGSSMLDFASLGSRMISRQFLAMAKLLSLRGDVFTPVGSSMPDLSPLRSRMIARQFLAMAKLLPLRSDVLTPIGSSMLDFPSLGGGVVARGFSLVVLHHLVMVLAGELLLTIPALLQLRVERFERITTQPAPLAIEPGLMGPVQTIKQRVKRGEALHIVMPPGQLAQAAQSGQAVAVFSFRPKCSTGMLILDHWTP